ncbi:hypothetical protein GDO86_011375 [Hymenochirus boettgeri]|uniref:Large ribosomal subunit protein bL9m n=1 Tax=Hymenochirus boettgeri TaxID=247094 RepID=A0A8T2JIV8_9PIPI|nr:hypothetical protein GDO86_011375 [Hymenochirus boettgeri]
MLSLTCRRFFSPGAQELLGWRAVCVTPNRGTVVVERWWKVNLSKKGEEPVLHPRRHRIYRVLEDTKHSKKQKMELILTQTVHKLGGRGDTVFVEKALGRNNLLANGLAVYPSPENKKMFEEEKRKQEEAAPGERMQTWTGEMVRSVVPLLPFFFSADRFFVKGHVHPQNYNPPPLLAPLCSVV